MVALAPKDTNALRELASLYLAQASAKQREAQILQARAAYQGAGQGFPGAFTSPTGQPLLEDSISTAIKTQSSPRIQELSTSAQNASAESVNAYKKIVGDQPEGSRTSSSSSLRPPSRPATRRR